VISHIHVKLLYATVTPPTPSFKLNLHVTLH